MRDGQAGISLLNPSFDLGEEQQHAHRVFDGRVIRQSLNGLKEAPRNYLTLIGMLFMGFSQFVLAQQWHAGDTLNTQETDTARIDQFRDNMIDYTGQDLVDASFPKSWPLFGTKTRMAIGGYFKLDYIQDFNGAYDRFQYEIQNVPIPGDGRPPQSSYMNMHARESRLNLDVFYLYRRNYFLQNKAYFLSVYQRPKLAFLS